MSTSPRDDGDSASGCGGAGSAIESTRGGLTGPCVNPRAHGRLLSDGNARSHNVKV